MNEKAWWVGRLLQRERQ